ncbi:FecR family protein [Aequorivita marisscotiae]|uniref:FecR family protein n=1 Tax=Aequorivita marisscotiae TaxID=3040348 RepID=A0ABY8KU97_9FLAO|nr:FecR family protein [Aequorivita sp. Ant34-E75]WGF93001.1 FecR family protein [Aequorivita sp. Ant34-E75]
MNTIKMDKDYILHKWLNNEATPEELEQLKADPKYASYLKIADASSGFEVADMNSEANFKAISNKTKPVRQLQKPNVFSVVWKVAAVFALLLAGYYYTTTLDTSIKTEVAQTETFSLPDGSEVALNSGSKITYNKKNWDDSRELSLDGEAYFKVTKGNKFSVKTAEGIVSVLGTQFNVAARDGLFTVTCYEGLVSVAFNNSLIKLPAGKKIEIINGKLVANEVTDNQSPLWLQQESSFNNVPLQRVINALERQYVVKINLKNVNLEKRFTGTFTHKNLELALKSICEPLQLTYKINKNGAVTIDAKHSK